MTKEDGIKSIVKMGAEGFAAGFKQRHESEIDNPEGVINKKVHNVFLAQLGPEIVYYGALSRSLDSSMGNMLEKIAINIASLFFEVSQQVVGEVSIKQLNLISDLLGKYKEHEIKPSTEDYQWLRIKDQTDTFIARTHKSDYFLMHKETGDISLIELKAGGDLDNKKARSEKEAILEQYAILANTMPESQKINIYFATAYNSYGEGQYWKQERVRQFFAPEELLIGKDFWNFVCDDENGYEMVLEAFKEYFQTLNQRYKEVDTLFESLEFLKNYFLGLNLFDKLQYD